MRKPKSQKKEEKKRAWFTHLRGSMDAAGLACSSDEALICPLCWEERSYEALRLEHIVPRSVGGNDVTLSCQSCNNNQGSGLDSQLTKYQAAKDAFQGHGEISTTIQFGDERIAATLLWGDGRKDFTVVPQATNPKSSEQLKKLAQLQSLPDLKVTLELGYSKRRFYTGVMRSAYLILFKCLGYEYVKHEGVQEIRRRICGDGLSESDMDCLIIELRNATLPSDRQHLVATSHRSEVGFFLVSVRLQLQTTTYIGAF